MARGTRIAALAALVVALIGLASATGCVSSDETYTVGGDNMVPALIVGERVYVDGIAPVTNGTVIAFEDPYGQNPALISRVIAMGRQTVDIHDGSVWLDGEQLDEPYASGVRTDPGTETLPEEIPRGHVWVMGDNRPDSGDSRHFGTIPYADIIGVVTDVYWPANSARPISPE